jgi:hypothetical protein
MKDEPEKSEEEPKKRVQQFMRDNRAAFVLARIAAEARRFKVVDGGCVEIKSGRRGMWCSNCGAMMLATVEAIQAHARWTPQCAEAMGKAERCVCGAKKMGAADVVGGAGDLAGGERGCAVRQAGAGCCDDSDGGAAGVGHGGDGA